MRHRLSELLAGARHLVAGLGTWGRDPGLMALGALPALIVGVVMLAGVILVALNVGAWATALTPFAEGWDAPLAGGLRFVLDLGIVVGVIVLCVLTFAAVVLTVGEPFYERIWRAVERRLGGIPDEVELPLGRQIAKGIRDGAVLIGIAILTALVVFLVGLIPLIGTAAGLVLGALLGGRALARELTGMAADARGMSLAERRALLATRPWRTLGFGIAAYLLMLVPAIAVIAMPAAVVGATLLVRDLRGEATSAPGPAA